MTAAIADAATPSTLDAAAPPFPGLLRAAPEQRRPYLAPVPQSAPPFDDELVDALPVVVASGTAVHGPRPTASATVVATATVVAARSVVAARNVAAARNVVARTTLGTTSLTPPAITRTAPATIAASGVPCWSKEADVGVVHTATAELPMALRAASVLARAVIEVLSGHRPVAQLRVHCAPAVYAGLCARTAAASRPLPHLLSVRVCEPTDGVAEASAVFRRADRVRALAFRLQGVDGRWRITALQVG